jgi:hypothetical protein
MYHYQAAKNIHVMIIDHRSSLLTKVIQDSEDDLNVDVLHELYIYFQNVQLPIENVSIGRLILFNLQLTCR